MRPAALHGPGRKSTAAATWPPEAVNLEYFSADSASLAGPRDTFTVRLARTGGDYVIPADKTIVEALKEHGIEIETSCEQGVCGTCLTGRARGRARSPRRIPYRRREARVRQDDVLRVAREERDRSRSI